ncbi:hypothetical protein LV779_03695 [Streptomyces thinghirensis]|nr:hypothetical protein [Streptomyces thinghirensis]
MPATGPHGAILAGRPRRDAPRTGAAAGRQAPVTVARPRAVLRCRRTRCRTRGVRPGRGSS